MNHSTNRTYLTLFDVFLVVHHELTTH